MIFLLFQIQILAELRIYKKSIDSSQYKLISIQLMNSRESESSNQYQKIGCSHFSKQFCQQILPTLGYQKVVTIKNKDWEHLLLDQEWTVVFKHLRKTECEVLISYWFLKEPLFKFQIIPSISHVSFVSLKKLNLRNNNICSIEAIAFLSMEALQKLLLYENFITITKPLNKTKWSRLKYFSIEQNRIQEEDITRIGLKGMERFKFDENNFKEIRFHNLIPFVKFQTVQLDALGQHSFVYDKRKLPSWLNRRFRIK